MLTTNNNVTIVTIRTYVFQAATDYDAKKESVNLTQDGSKADNLTNACQDYRSERPHC